MGTHVGRSWPNLAPHLEDECPCPQEPCGLVDLDKVDPSCTQHTLAAAKTIRSSHAPERCPGVRPDAP